MTNAKLGSPAWLDRVWSSPPVDRIKGRSRWTQAHQPWCDHLERHSALQGRFEFVALLVLEYLHSIGLITRFKEHAFATSAGDLGWETRPDLFAQDAKGRLLVIEVKTARFVTQAVAAQLAANRDAFKRFGLEYLVWTDAHPLTRPVRHNLQYMRRAATEDVAPAEVDRLRDLLVSEGVMSLRALSEHGFDLVAVFAAWWRGAVSLPLTSDVTEQTPVRLLIAEDYGAIFIDERPLRDDWWQQLLPR